MNVRVGSVAAVVLTFGICAAQDPALPRLGDLPRAAAGALQATLPNAAPLVGAPVAGAPMGNPTPMAGGEGQARVVDGHGNKDLPNDAGQVWKEYPISGYTARVTNGKNPEQAIIDWILRETGTDLWFSGPTSLLNADKNTLRVYHTPEVQRTVADIVERFVRSQSDTQVLGLRLCTITSPNWRSQAYRLMRPVSVQAPGVEAWLLSKENATLLVHQIGKRADYREHSSPNLMIHNGQTHVLTRVRPRNYVRSVGFREGGGWPNHELEMSQIQEGYTLQLSPLMSVDGRTIDCVIKCDIDQIEKLVSVNVEVPLAPGQVQNVSVQVPQIVSWRLHERFRWPIDQVLLLSCGVVATPTQDNRTALGLPSLMPSAGRADALLFIEGRGKASQAVNSVETANQRSPANYRGRY